MAISAETDVVDQFKESVSVMTDYIRRTRREKLRVAMAIYSHAVIARSEAGACWLATYCDVAIASPIDDDVVSMTSPLISGTTNNASYKQVTVL